MKTNTNTKPSHLSLDLNKSEVEDLVDSLIFAHRVGPVGAYASNPCRLIQRWTDDPILDLSKYEVLDLLGALSIANRHGFKGKDKMTIPCMLEAFREYLEISKAPNMQETINRMRHQNINIGFTLPDKKDWMWAK